MKNKRILASVFPIVALILAALPYGAVLNFFDPETGVIKRTYSYFNLTPFAYANFAPFITALLTVSLLALSVWYCVKENKNLKIGMTVLSVVAFACSLLPLAYGISYFSVVGAFISVALLSNSCLLIFNK